VTASIYINYFTPAKLMETRALKPIQVGAAKSDLDLGILRDDNGDNISGLNPSYCEMTGIYWAWKNDTASETIGFFHYRRYLDFRPDILRATNNVGMIDYPALDSAFLEEFGLTEANIRAQMDGADMIVPEPFDVRGVGSPSLRKHYETAPHHHIKDLDRAGQIIADLSPECAPFFDQMMDGHALYPNNMFVFRRPVFERYCAWIFPILARLESEIDTSAYNWQESRAVGYIAERLFTVFLLTEKARDQNLKVKEFRRILVAMTAPEPSEPTLPDTDLRVMTVVASSDSAYVPHLAALIVSVFRSTRPDVYVDFIVLDGGLTKGQRKLVQSLARLRDAAAISFVDMRFKHLHTPVHSYFARATFFRLSLPDILEKRDQILFLDTDMVVIDDLWDVASVDLEGALVAATPDLVMRAFSEMGVRSLDQTGGLTSKDYLANYLGMGESGHAYFQAGLLVMDLAAMRAEKLSERLIADLAGNTYWFLDQDVLNKNLLGRVKLLDNRYNVVWMDNLHASALGGSDHLLYTDASQDPAVVHFAGIGKPWLNLLNPYSHYYWQHLRETPFYETILFQHMDRCYGVTTEAVKPRRSAVVRGVLRVAVKLWQALPNAVKVRIWPLAVKIKAALT